MRKIEREMNAAITQQRDWKSANTEVVNVDGITEVFLHNNLIAEVGDTFIRLFDGGWRSNTTKSRLNAILAEHGVPGEHVFQKDFQWFVRTVQGVKTTDKEGFRNVPFFSGIEFK